MFIFTEGVNGAGIDSVGTVPASLITFASIQALQPDILINAGTCGAFKVHYSSFTFSFSLYVLVRMPCLIIFELASLTRFLNLIQSGLSWNFESHHEIALSLSLVRLFSCCGS